MSKLENSGDVGWTIFPISFNFCSSPDTRQRPCGQETGVTIKGTLVIADTALCKVSSTFLQLVDAPAQFVWCDVMLVLAAPRSLVVCFYSVGVDTDKDIEYSALAISQHFTQYAATTTHCHADMPRLTARLGRKFQFAILKLFPEVSNHQSIPERSLIKQECYLHKMQCREEAADTELVCRHR